VFVDRSCEERFQNFGDVESMRHIPDGDENGQSPPKSKGRGRCGQETMGGGVSDWTGPGFRPRPSKEEESTTPRPVRVQDSGGFGVRVGLRGGGKGERRPQGRL